MLCSPKRSLLLALLLIAGCASLEPSSLPAVAASYPVDRADFVPVAHDGRIGVWVSEDALGGMLAGFEIDKGALKVEIARAKVGEQLATERAEAIERNAKALSWRAEYGPWLGFVGGMVLSAGVVGIGVYIGGSR